MAEAARKLLPIEDWLVFRGGTDARHKFVEGQLTDMSPTVRLHGLIAQNVGGEMERPRLTEVPAPMTTGIERKAKVLDDSFPTVEEIWLVGGRERPAAGSKTLTSRILGVEIPLDRQHPSSGL